MARFALLVLAVSALAGCASRDAFVESIPPPSFAGPTVQHQPAQLPVLAPPPPPRPQPQIATGPRDWAPVASPRAWRWIVIHHSATSSGSAYTFDRMHKQKGWDELGYHFVIGNGTETGNGAVEVGPRWTRQKWGAHAKTPDNRFNDYGIGICLVGNFDIERPTAQQMQSLARLVAHLMRAYHVPPERIIGHADTGKPTECPGRNLSVATVRRMASQIIADSGDGMAAIPAAETLNADTLEPLPTAASDP